MGTTDETFNERPIRDGVYVYTFAGADTASEAGMVGALALEGISILVEKIRDGRLSLKAPSWRWGLAVALLRKHKRLTASLYVKSLDCLGALPSFQAFYQQLQH